MIAIEDFREEGGDGVAVNDLAANCNANGFIYGILLVGSTRLTGVHVHDPICGQMS